MTAMQDALRARNPLEAGLLTINAGSSSIKFAMFEVRPSLRRVSSGRIERIGLPGSRMTVDDPLSGQSDSISVHAPDHKACVPPLMTWLEEKGYGHNMAAVGHRIVHGGPRYREPLQVTAEVLHELERMSPYDPEHLPAELGLVEALAARYPAVPQIACFDTAFHGDMPRVARILPIPRRYDSLGVQRYGFHGLSYAYLMHELERVAGRKAALGRVILAHLGNGASLAAVAGGVSQDTTMAFTPTAGLPMSTRSGDLDPGLLSYLSRTEGMTVEQFHRMVNAQSGLLGVSETSSDLRDLLAAERHDPRAAEAIALFCYSVKKWLGAYVAALGGIDTLVFSGGIGENAPVVRARMCQGLDCLGIVLNEEANQTGHSVISEEGERVIVRVIRTDEEVQMARFVDTWLKHNITT
jgi:acetate kinase